mmetsp:Transcript_94573/g.185467  ORF Transcript_94573/g.185467 Transcript_94573/m.185467 type:complete len:283 (-) Transcript_94573:154-1002(-)
MAWAVSREVHEVEVLLCRLARASRERVAGVGVGIRHGIRPVAREVDEVADRDIAAPRPAGLRQHAGKPEVLLVVGVEAAPKLLLRWVRAREVAHQGCRRGRQHGRRRRREERRLQRGGSVRLADGGARALPAAPHDELPDPTAAERGQLLADPVPCILATDDELSQAPAAEGRVLLHEGGGRIRVNPRRRRCAVDFAIQEARQAPSQKPAQAPAPEGGDLSISRARRARGARRRRRHVVGQELPRRPRPAHFREDELAQATTAKGRDLHARACRSGGTARNR